ncbi:MAG: amidohydrolase [Oscillospiraceae bacterium]|jgi:5-methylthioadenosine/S-adenosylhomocysteine deaminase|nr:amidohydrolase [Oscillospiraceae bacterium]
MDTLFKNVTAVLMDSANSVLDNAYVGVEAGKIAYVGTTPLEGAAGSVIDGARKVLMPGIVNAHTHLPMTLLRGIADDLDLQTWLFQHIFPAEEKLTGELVYTGTQLALMECIASGTVSVTDMYFFSADLARAVAESGIKGNLCRPFAGETVEGRMEEALELIAQYHGYDNGRILIDAAVHAEYTSIPAVWEAAAALAKEHGLGMHVHLSETEKEHNDCMVKYDMTPAAVFDKYSLFAARTTAAHCVHVNDWDMSILAARGATAVHNPVSNLKLGSGVARVRAMQKKGINVALGTDGAASNNSLDMFEEMKTAAILAAGGDPLTAAGALRLATCNGAKSQGRSDETGAIAVGKDADLILVDFDRPHLTPRYSAVSSLVYSARGSDVVMTMVRGKTLYKDGEFLTLDREKILFDTRKAACIF